VTKTKKSDGQTAHASLKRSSDDMTGGSTAPTTKVKKPKKSGGGEHSSPSSNASGFKEISILSSVASPSSADPLKTKNSNSARKLKDERTARRKSVDNSDSPKQPSKESKHKSNKEAKVKKEKSLDLGASGGIPKLKFSLKRTPDESGGWAATAVSKDSNVASVTVSTDCGGSGESVPNTVLTANSTTASQQNDQVRRVISEFRRQSSGEDDEEDSIKMEEAPLLNSSLSSVDSLNGSANNLNVRGTNGGGSTKSSKHKSSSHKSSSSNVVSHNRGGKVMKELKEEKK
jgi:hypothetical protein